MKRPLVIIGCCVLAAISLVLLIPTLVVGFEGGFRWRGVCSEVSPDGQFQVIVIKRMAFPANEWVDPSVVVRVDFREAATHRVVASGQALLVEDSDFDAPAVQWVSGQARVTGFDRRKHQSLTLGPRHHNAH